LACELLLQALEALCYSFACVDRTSKYLYNLINDKPGASLRNSQRLLPQLNQLTSLFHFSNLITMSPTLSGTLSLFTAPPAPRIPRSPKDVTSQGSGSSKKYPYFTSGDLDSEKAVIFLGGLTNGMGAVPYVHKLSEELKGAGWNLYVTRVRAKLTSRIQPHWTSAYDGYGLSSLETDVLEMGALVDHIRSEDGKYLSILSN
jgi:hypothetical protein